MLKTLARLSLVALVQGVTIGSESQAKHVPKKVIQTLPMTEGREIQMHEAWEELKAH